ncbi:MAG TPA: hypothetical protein VGB37_04035 [Candidatus Lokiarchaeia archaeon]
MKKLFYFIILFLPILLILVGCSFEVTNGDRGKKGHAGKNGINGNDGVDGEKGFIYLNPPSLVFSEEVTSGEYIIDIIKDVKEKLTGFKGIGIVSIKFVNKGISTIILNNDVLTNYELKSGKYIIVFLSITDGNINFNVGNIKILCTSLKLLDIELLSYTL